MNLNLAANLLYLPNLYYAEIRRLFRWSLLFQRQEEPTSSAT